MIENADIVDFLQKKGAMEFLVEIGEEPKRHTDLREKFLLSSSTLHGRLKRGSQLGLWEQTLKERDDGLSSKIYRLSEKGQEVYDVAADHRVSRYHKTRRDAVRHVRKAEAETLKALSHDDAPWLEEIEPLIEIDQVETQRGLGEFVSNSGALLNARQRRGRVSNSLFNSLRRTILRPEDAVAVADDVP